MILHWETRQFTAEVKDGGSPRVGAQRPVPINIYVYIYINEWSVLGMEFESLPKEVDSKVT